MVWGFPMGWVSYSDDDDDRRTDSLPCGNAPHVSSTDSSTERQRGKCTPADAGLIGFGAYAIDWLRSQRFDEPTRRAVYEWLSRLIIPHLGQTALVALTPTQLRTWDLEMRRRNLTPRIRQKLHIHVQAILNSAVAEGRIPENPATFAEDHGPDR